MASKRRRGGNPPRLAMRRCVLVGVFALGSLAVLAGEAPEERTEQTETPADEQGQAEPSAGEREGLAPRQQEPSAGEREGLAPRTQEPSAGEREGLAPRQQEPVPKNELPKPRAQTRVSLEDAAAIVRQAYGGRVVSTAAATARPDRARPKEPGHRVRVDVDGRVKTVFVDERGRIHEDAEY